MPRKYGESKCDAIVVSTGNQCTNNAYYKQDRKYLCGIHSDEKKRKILDKDKDKKKAKLALIEKHEKHLKKQAKKRQVKGIKGQVKCSGMRMMKEVPLIKDYRNIFPNNKHGNRCDGKGMPSLSPMRLGPVIHNELDLPIALNIENYHQFSKVWPNEVDDKGNPTQTFRERQIEGFQDPIPHRHKFSTEVMTQLRKSVNGENRNQPLYSVHKTIDGEERRFTYVESRYFYCHFYEILAKETSDFAKLKSYLDKGINLLIVGFDGYEVINDLYTHYCDEKKPFGHELVLYSLLTIDDPDNYPWNVYKKRHANLYEKMIV